MRIAAAEEVSQARYRGAICQSMADSPNVTLRLIIDLSPSANARIAEFPFAGADSPLSANEPLSCLCRFLPGELTLACTLRDLANNTATLRLAELPIKSIAEIAGELSSPDLALPARDTRKLRICRAR